MTFTHGHTRNGTYTPEYNSWRGMIHRCHRPNSTIYYKYGARGIAVCERWRNAFEAFLEDMGPRPDGQTLDRYPNKIGNYQPDNCRWATPKQQCNNKTDNHLVTIDGCEMTLTEASELCGIAYGSFKSRILRGWSIERAISEPLRQSAIEHLTDSDREDIRREYAGSIGVKQVKRGTRARLAEKFGVNIEAIKSICRVTVKAVP